MVNIKGDKIEVYEEKENKGEEMKNVNENIETGLKAGLEAMDKGEMPARELTDVEKAQLEESLKAYEAAAIAAKEAVFAAIEKGEKMENFDHDFAHLTDEQKEVAKDFLSKNVDAIENVRQYAEEKAKEFFSSASEATEEVVEDVSSAAEEVVEATVDFIEGAADTSSDFAEEIGKKAEEVKEDVKAAVEETADNGGSKWLRRLGYVAATAVVAVGGYALYKRFGGESVAEEAVAELIESFRK
nr:MAG TPA: hypothetical protein [Caudoviricetes sp.]